MAIYPDQLVAACPHCGLNPPFNFKLEKRLNFKKSKEPVGYEKIAEKEVVVCVKCGKELSAPVENKQTTDNRRKYVKP